ncbi:MAG: putative calcium/sodium:proton antiporter [Frankiales bacterium]|nr:putative calcium/sodium:proton antiporter [Frankiales bacterium]
MLHVLLLVASAGAIYFACELFVNAVEHLGRLLQVGALAVGTVLAAVGTALPESVVTAVAVLRGNADDIGVGAAMGGPLALATVAYAVVGIALLLRHQALGKIDTARLGRDQAAFLGIFACKVGLGLVAFAWKPWLGLLFFAGYGVYVWVELRAEDDSEAEELEPLRLGGSATPRVLPVVVQTVATLAVIFIGSQVFVDQLSWAGPQLGLSATVTALLLAPVATELPEVMNALIWLRQGKTQLALSNISGSMMVQATVPSGFGILFTAWHFDGPLMLSGLVTAAAIVFLLAMLRRGRLTRGALAGAGAFYLVFALGLFVV